MPSPIAHASLTFFTRPVVGTSAFDAMTRGQRVTLLLCVALALLAPDVDFLFLISSTDTPALAHGGALHSLMLAPLFGLAFACVTRVAFRLPASYRRLVLTGGLAYASHVLLDVCTYGRGVMALWPAWQERIVLPWPLFFGVRHSHPGAFHLHLVTIATELALVGLVWMASRRWMTRRHRAARDHASTTATPLTDRS